MLVLWSSLPVHVQLMLIVCGYSNRKVICYWVSTVVLISSGHSLVGMFYDPIDQGTSPASLANSCSINMQLLLKGVAHY